MSEFPMDTKPLVFMTAPNEGVLFDPQGKFHGWLMRRNNDGLWVSMRKLPAVDPEDNDLIRQLFPNPKQSNP